MTYEVLDIESGDVLAEYGSQEQACDALAHYVEEHPDEVDDLAIAEIDDAGQATAMTPAASLIETLA